ncbi:MAG: peptide-methionine (S)-S-oxide reductase MsrA [Terrimicrobiaceae bacterium]|nr:peptide-methionine (S)-S-oxide reductase MsrA [Terrimicrobiaceae bacterium]
MKTWLVGLVISWLGPGWLVMGADSGGRTAEAILGGGCFWCIEAVFERVPGVLSVESGYAGGSTPRPTYEQVCRGDTGHAEVVKIRFDPDKVSFRELLDVFWKAHDPTTKDRQGADVGTQYRSIILALDDRQLEEAMASKDEAQSRFSSPIVTEIRRAGEFYPAEDYHQDFFRNNPGHPYNRAVIEPKLRKLGQP